MRLPLDRYLQTSENGMSDLIQINKTQVFGVMFEINVTEPVTITEFPMEITSTEDERVEIYKRNGHLKYLRSPNAWTLHGNTTVTGMGEGKQTIVMTNDSDMPPLELTPQGPGNGVYSLYITLTNRLMNVNVYEGTTAVDDYNWQSSIDSSLCGVEISQGSFDSQPDSEVRVKLRDKRFFNVYYNN